jgi:hypothetical protein
MSASRSQAMFAAAIDVISSATKYERVMHAYAVQERTLRVIHRRDFHDVCTDNFEPIQTLDDLFNLARREPTDRRTAGFAPQIATWTSRKETHVPVLWGKHSLSIGGLPRRRRTYAGATLGSSTSMSKVMYTGLSPTTSRIFFTIPRQPISSISSACEITKPTSASFL